MIQNKLEHFKNGKSTNKNGWCCLLLCIGTTCKLSVYIHAL